MSVIALAAGGTAGHIEPAIACAKAIKEIDNNANVFIVGTSKGLERDINSSKRNRTSFNSSYSFA
jgi:UDP-N-acetylglucosamine:LPS N-acetylglucosamine transferase